MPRLSEIGDRRSLRLALGLQCRERDEEHEEHDIGQRIADDLGPHRGGSAAVEVGDPAQQVDHPDRTEHRQDHREQVDDVVHHEVPATTARGERESHDVVGCEGQPGGNQHRGDRDVDDERGRVEQYREHIRPDEEEPEHDERDRRHGLPTIASVEHVSSRTGP